MLWCNHCPVLITLTSSGDQETCNVPAPTGKWHLSHEFPERSHLECNTEIITATCNILLFFTGSTKLSLILIPPLHGFSGISLNLHDDFSRVHWLSLGIKRNTRKSEKDAITSLQWMGLFLWNFMGPLLWTTHIIHTISEETLAHSKLCAIGARPALASRPGWPNRRKPSGWRHPHSLMTSSDPDWPDFVSKSVSSAHGLEGTQEPILDVTIE